MMTAPNLAKNRKTPVLTRPNKYTGCSKRLFIITQSINLFNFFQIISVVMACAETPKILFLFSCVYLFMYRNAIHYKGRFVF